MKNIKSDNALLMQLLFLPNKLNCQETSVIKEAQVTSILLIQSAARFSQMKYQHTFLLNLKTEKVNQMGHRVHHIQHGEKTLMISVIQKAQGEQERELSLS